MLERLKNAFQMLSRGEEIDAALKEVQRALIASDVDVQVVLDLTKKIRDELSNKPPGIPAREYAARILYDEIVRMLGGERKDFPFVPQRIMLLGLYGAGKTTTAGKLARLFMKKGLTVTLVCADVYRPAAYDQLKQVAEKVGAKFYGKKEEKDPVKIVEEAMGTKTDVYIVDTAGRSALEDDLVEEIKRIKYALIPEKTLLVIPADMGHAAGKEAERFNEEVGIDGIIITKMDGSGKGGGALSAIAKTGVPVYFIGTGEKLEDLEVFDAARFVSRILGVPDVKRLMEMAAEVSEDVAMPEVFDINVFYQQISAARKPGFLDGLLSSLGIGSIPKDAMEIAEEKFKKYDAIYKSMTKYERAHPEVLNASRIARIAKGSGTTEEDVRAFIRDFKRAEKMYRKLKKKRRYFEKMLEKGKLPVLP